MPWDRPSKVTIAMVVAGFSAALVVYLIAAPDETDPLQNFEQSKKYLADVERIGGKAAVFSIELENWFSGLWHGQSLAFTIAALTIILSLGYLFMSRRLSSED